MVIGAGRVGGGAEAGVVCGCRGITIGRARVGQHKLVGQGVLVVAVAAAYSLVGVAVLATWLGSPPIYISCPQAQNKKAVAPACTSPVGGLCRPVLGV